MLRLSLPTYVLVVAIVIVYMDTGVFLAKACYAVAFLTTTVIGRHK